MKSISTVLLISLLGLFVLDASAQEFKVRFASEAYKKPFTGTVVVYLSKTEKEPIKREQWSLLPVVFGMDVENLKSGDWIKIPANHQRSFPVSPDQIERGKYYAQVVFDLAKTPLDRSAGTSPGNIVSKSVELTISNNKKQVHSLTADSLLKPKKFESTKHLEK